MKRVLLLSLLVAVSGQLSFAQNPQWKEEDLLFFGKWDEPDAPAAAPSGKAGEGTSKRPAKLTEVKIGTILLDRPENGWATAQFVTVTGKVEQRGTTAQPEVVFLGGTASLSESAGNAGTFLTANNADYPDGVNLLCNPSGSYTAVERDAAGAAVAVMLEAIASGRQLDSTVAILGGVAKDGAVTAISDAGTRVRTLGTGQASAVIVAPSNEPEIRDLALMSELDILVRAPVIAAARITDAAEAASATRTGNVAKAFELFAGVQQAASRSPLPGLIKNPSFQQRLTEVVKLMPGHLSARLLLQAGTGKLAGVITFGTSQQAILKATKPFWDSVFNKEAAPQIKKNATECANVLLRMEPRINPVVKRYLVSTKAYLRGVNNLLDIPNDPPHARMYNDKVAELDKITGEIKVERGKLDKAAPKK